MPAPKPRTIVTAIAGLLAIGIVAAVAPHIHADLDPADVEARYAPEPSRFMDVAGQRTHYRDEGSGDVTVVLIHGTASSLHTWNGWAEALKDRYRVVRMDLPAFGLTGPSADEDYSIPAYVDFVHAFTSELGIDRFVLAGNSLGGLIAWRYALAHPEDVLALGLVDAAGHPNPDPFFIEIGKLPVLGEALSWLTPLPIVRDQLERVYHDPSRIAPGTAERFHALLLRRGNRRAYRLYTRTDRLDVSPERLAEIAAPTLVMWGADDHTIPVEHAQYFMDALPNARLVIYDDAGHVPMEEIPQRSAADFADFVERSRDGTGPSIDPM